MQSAILPCNYKSVKCKLYAIRPVQQKAQIISPKTWKKINNKCFKCSQLDTR
jgi:hypothetical protein